MLPVTPKRCLGGGLPMTVTRSLYGLIWRSYAGHVQWQLKKIRKWRPIAKHKQCKRHCTLQPRPATPVLTVDRASLAAVRGISKFRSAIEIEISTEAVFVSCGKNPTDVDPHSTVALLAAWPARQCGVRLMPWTVADCELYLIHIETKLLVTVDSSVDAARTLNGNSPQENLR